VRIAAYGIVTSLRIEPEEGTEGKVPNMAIQLTDMDVAADSGKSAASVLYGA
jgi:hypothetical protein